MFTFETCLPMNCHMSFLSEGRRERRMVERCPVDEAAVVRHHVARNQPPPEPYPATVVDVSSLGAALRVPLDFDLLPNRMVEIGIDGTWTRARVVWSRVGLDGCRIGGIEFAEALPEFLPALGRWLDRHDVMA
jgi:hypothetical protein